MKDGALKWALRLLGLALAIAPIIIAFSINNWNLRETVLPSNEEIVQIQNQVTSAFGGGFSQDSLVFDDPVFSGSSVSVSVTFRSPFNVPMRITEASIGVSDQGVKIMDLHLDEDFVEVPASGTASFTLVGLYSGAEPTDPQFESMDATFEIYGLTVDIHTGVMGGVL